MDVFVEVGWLIYWVGIFWNGNGLFGIWKFVKDFGDF
jgi:hypothetical protein